MNEITDPKQFDQATLKALVSFLLSLADNKRALGLRYAEWSSNNRSHQASAAATACAQNELAHSRTLLALLCDFPDVAPAVLEQAPREKYSNMTFLDDEFKDWSTCVAANVFIAAALTEALKAARESCYAPLRVCAMKILDERSESIDGEGWFKRLTGESSEGIELAYQTEEILPQALCWFGHTENDPLVREKILDASADELRTRYLTRVGPLLVKSQSAHLIKIEGGRWQFAHTLPWTRFDPVTRRVK